MPGRPNVFAGRRWVAPRRHKQARFPADPDIGFARLDGSYAAIYFILEGHHQDWLDWAGPQAEQLHADGRGFEHRAHYNTGTYRHEWRAHRDPDPVPLELALDHPYQGLVAMWIEAEPGVRQPELDTWFGRQFLDWLPGSPVACVSSWSVLPLASEPGFMSRAAEPNTVRRLQLHFVDTDPLDCWDRYREFGGRVEASGLAHVVRRALHPDTGRDRPLPRRALVVGRAVRGPTPIRMEDDVQFWCNLTFVDLELLPELCRKAEELGFDGVAIGEHLVTFETQYNQYLYTDDGQLYWQPETHWVDNWVAFAALAQHTTTLRFINSVFVLPLRDPLSVAKAISTAARFSDDRITLAVGVGWQKAEFDIVGQSFSNRGKRADEMLEIIPRLMAGEMMEYHGQYYDFPRLQMSPAVGQPVPIMVGGNSDAALARAARHDGWYGTQENTAAMPAIVERLRAERRRAGRPDDTPFDVLVAILDLTPARVVELEDIGVTMLSTTTPALTEQGYRHVDLKTAIADLERFAESYLR